MSGRMTGRVPFRMCAACRRRAPKQSLVRFAAKDGVLMLDADYSMGGRGAYVCPNIHCFSKAVGSGAFVRALKSGPLVVPEGLRSDFSMLVRSRYEFEGEGKDG